MAEKHGYESVDEFVTVAVLESILQMKGKKVPFDAKELLDRYYEAKRKQPNLNFADFLDQSNK